MTAEIKPGSLAQLKETGIVEEAVALKVIELQEVSNDKRKCTFSDGKENIHGVFTSQVVRQFGDALKNDTIIKITEANVNSVSDGHILVVAAMEVLGSAPAAADDIKTENQPTKMEVDDNTAKPVPADGAAVADIDTPAVDAKTPAAGIKSAAKMEPRTGPTPPSTGPYGAPTSGEKSASSHKNVQPISALNPYKHGWAVRVKVVSKGPKRSFNKGGAPSSVFTAELVDDQGTAIEATFWKEGADRCYNMMEDDKVYVLGRGSVKPANKKYSQVRNDYCLHFDNAVEISASEVEIDTSAMTAKLQFVPIDQLYAFVDKKSLIDIVGVVTSVAPMGSVKRKSDNVELARRDVTLVDTACRSVTVTLWGTTAQNAGAQIEDAYNTVQSVGSGSVVVAISSCRVSSYNGVSVSTVQRSQVVIDSKDMPEVTALKGWWEEAGQTATISPVGEGMDTALKPQGAGGPGGAQRAMIDAFKESAPASVGDKPTYGTIIATFAAINPEKTMWYEACPENNRKVTMQGDGTWLCEYDGKTYPSMTRRYIINTPIADPTGEAYVQVFDDHAKTLLGRSADDMAALKEGDEAGFTAALKSTSWTEWVLRVKAQTQEYNGEPRVRYAVADIKPLDFVAESRRMLAELSGAQAA